MMLLICLKVKYGFHLNSLYGFLQHQDYKDWNSYLSRYPCEAGISAHDGVIYWLVRSCHDVDNLKNEITKLPLVEEGFLDLQILDLVEFKSLSSLFKDIN